MVMISNTEMLNSLTWQQKFFKRSFDIIFSMLGLLVFGWLIIFCFILSSIDTKQNGFFTQTRIGRFGKHFRVIKIRTMRNVPEITTSITQASDPRITKLGSYLRKYKLDELPQLINVFWGDMSFVGPRPDVPGFADQLKGADRIILSIRPGITGPATLQFKHEEELLAKQSDPEKFNKEVIFPNKIALNRTYIENYSFWKDIACLLQTIMSE